jgi:DNA recombination protein RmuC
MSVLLPFALLAVLLGAAVLGVWASRLRSELERARGERDSAVAQGEEASSKAAELPEVRQQLAATKARLEALEEERNRMLGKDGERSEQTSKHVTQLRSDLESIKKDLPKILDHSSKAASGAERVESGMTSWMQTIANPQSRGAFGELAVENQLRNLGLERGRDYMRQVAGDDGRLRPDFVVRTGEASVVIDAKFALDEDLAGVGEAIEAEDPERLLPYGRKLRARAEELAKRDYSKIADRSRALVLLYVPVEGAYEALRVLPNFSIEKFSQRHRVYVVTPSQLGLALGFVAEVAHDARRSEETERVAGTLLDVAADMANLVDQLDQHGRHLQTAFTSYDKLVGMTATRSNLWRRMSSVFEFARRTPSVGGEVRRLNPTREDAGEIAERWRESAAEDR